MLSCSRYSLLAGCLPHDHDGEGHDEENTDEKDSNATKIRGTKIAKVVGASLIVAGGVVLMSPFLLEWVGFTPAGVRAGMSILTQIFQHFSSDKQVSTYSDSEVRWQLEFSLNATGLRSQRIHFFSLMQSAGATGVLSSSTTIIVGSTLVATGVITYFIADWIEKDYTVGEMEKHRSKILIGNSPASDDFVNAEFICGGVSEGYHCWVKRKWAIGFMEFRSKKVT